MTKLNEMTAEHLGDAATEQDLDEFKGWAHELVQRDGLSEEEAIATLWGEGEVYHNAVRLGLTTWDELNAKDS